MSTPILTQAAATHLYHTGKAFLEGPYGLVTRQALYQWDPTLGHYERISDGLRLRHRLGARWNGAQKRFVACHCDHCAKYPETTAEVEIY